MAGDEDTVTRVVPSGTSGFSSNHICCIARHKARGSPSRDPLWSKKVPHGTTASPIRQIGHNRGQRRRGGISRRRNQIAHLPRCNLISDSTDSTTAAHHEHAPFLACAIVRRRSSTTTGPHKPPLSPLWSLDAISLWRPGLRHGALCSSGFHHLGHASVLLSWQACNGETIISHRGGQS